jgi:hypothetical protein
MVAATQIMSGGPGMSLGVSRDMSDDGWQRMLEVHLFGTFYRTRRPPDHSTPRSARLARRLGR